MAIGVGGLVALILLALLCLAVLPFGLFKDVVQRRLSDRFGRTVTIRSLDRIGGIGFNPTVVIRGIRVPQARWAGSGDFARIEEARATFSVWPLLRGSFAPRDMVVRGARLALVRDRDGRDNWSREGEAKAQRGGTELGGLVVADGVVGYRDDKQDRRVVVRLSSDPVRGVRVAGRGSVRGAAVTVGLTGPSLARLQGRPWPFTARIDGPALAMTATGTMDRALDTEHMALDVTARADDLKLIDAVIEAGLFRTQPVSLSAHVRRDGPEWTISRLEGRIGQSDLSGRLHVAKPEGRTRLDGDIVSRRFDFDDLASDEGLAQGAALERRIGPRLVPNARINIAKITDTDARIGFRIGRIVSRDGQPSGLRAIRGTLALDRQRLVVAPLTLVLPQGTATGRAVIDQRGGRRMPTLDLDLTLRGGTIAALVGGGGDFTGRVTVHGHIRGAGDTIRAAFGNGSGRIGLVARDGVLPEQIADILGFDAGRAFFAGNDDRAGLRCAVLGLDIRDGRGRIDPMIVDTTRSQMRGEGTVTFPDETVAIRLTGAPKRGSILRLPGSAIMTGTIQAPHVTVPHEVKSVGNIFRAIGRAITGRQGPEATDADCAALGTRVLR